MSIRGRSLSEFIHTVAGMACLSKPLSTYTNSLASNSWGEVMKQAVEDLETYLKRDPALDGDAQLALNRHGPFVGVIGYRVTHWLWQLGLSEARREAIALHQFIKVNTGSEIHPAAEIGRRFVLDHAYGTVIGATSRVGNDCYILNGVTIGARGIADNQNVKRHPTIGNNVQIGSFARVLGDITIGNNVVIGPLSCVTKDVSDCSTVRAFQNDQQAAVITNRAMERLLNVG